MLNFDMVSVSYSSCCTMAMPLPKVLTLGCSPVKKLHNDSVAGFNDRAAIDFNFVVTASMSVQCQSFGISTST